MSIPFRVLFRQCRVTLALVASTFFAGPLALPGGVTALMPVPPPADLRVAAVQVRVVPDHGDWTYRVGEQAKFRITVTVDGTPIEGAGVRYTVAPDLMSGDSITAQVGREGLTIEGGTMNEPGFLRCIVTAEVAGQTWKGMATAAFSPEKIQPLQTEPEDFDEFWQKEVAKLSALPVEPTMTLLPDAGTDQVDVFHVSFRTVGETWNGIPARIFGILCQPKNPGKYPAVLKVPGAGVRSYGGNKALAARGVISLEIGVHGIPVNLADHVYEALHAGPLDGYWLFNFDDPEKYYFRRIYLSCIRANDFLASRENWDGKNLVVMGGSQGGLLSMVTAALDPRVTGLIVTHPAYCDVAAPLHGRAGGWPHPFQPDITTGAPSFHATEAKIKTATYYDGVNFARRLKVPGYYTWGYNDEVCPPTSMYAAYNTITAPKTLGLALELAHSTTREQREAIDAWLGRFLDLQAP